METVPSKNPRKMGNNKKGNRNKFLFLSLEGLESRLTPAALNTQSIDLIFNVPEATANLGLQFGLYSNKSFNYLELTNDSYTVSPYSSISRTNLPLITVTPPENGGQVTIPVPLTSDLKSAELILFVGPNQGLSFKKNQVSTPNSVPSPATASPPDTFAQFEFNYTTTDGLDIDISSVDSLGFPFTIVYPQSEVGYPLNPLGITLDQKDLNGNLLPFLQKQGSVDGQSVADLFGQCATYVQQQDPSSLVVVAPGNILSNGPIPPAIGSASIVADASSGLVANASYFYVVTAYSNNLIDGTAVQGETLPSNYTNVSNIPADKAVEIQWTPYRDPNTAGYNIYRYASTDGTAPTDSTLYNFVGSVSGMLPSTGKMWTFTDNGLAPQAPQISAATASPYGFNPLSEYYTKEIKSFFEHYEAPNSFSIHRDGVDWLGQTIEYRPTSTWNSGGYTYRVLHLTAQGSTHTINQGDIASIYEPIFASNTRYVRADAPPMPSWMTGTSPFESPAQMVFACDGVFASDKFDPDAVSAVGDIENSIVSALNRGIATTFYQASTGKGLVPNNWASFPQITAQPTVDLLDPTNNIYYAVSAVNLYGETTPSAVILAKQGSPISWANGAHAAPALSYNVYAGTSPDQLYLQTTGSSSSIFAPKIIQQSVQPPIQYFAPKTTSNYYAAYVSQDSLLDPVKGVSINGLSYGFPYSDQGGLSTNLDFPIDGMPSQVTINLGVPQGPGFVTQMLPQATVGSPYQTKIIPSATESATFNAVTSLPIWAKLALDGTITGTPPSAGSWNFLVQATANGLSNTISFTLSTVTGTDAKPVTVSGMVAGNVTLSPAIAKMPYTASIQASGGVGAKYWMALDPTKTPALPPGISLPIGAGPIQSDSNGMFTLNGTQTTAQTAGLGVVVSDTTVAVASAIYGISKAQFSPNNLTTSTGYAIKDSFPVTGGGGTGAIVVTGVKANGQISTWDVSTSKGFATGNFSVGQSNSKNGKGATFSVGSNPGKYFQAVVTILNGGSGYSKSTPPNIKIYGGGGVSGFTQGTATINAGSVQSVTSTAANLTAQAGALLVTIDPPTPTANLPVSLNLTVTQPLALTTISLPGGAVGQPYNQQLILNTSVPFEFSVKSGTLPDGLYLTPWGLITGKPTTNGQGQPFTVNISDSTGVITSGTIPGISVNPAPSTPLTITPNSPPGKAFSLPGTAPNASYSATLSASGGYSPYTFAIANGVFPSWLTLNPSTGQITGTCPATQGGSFPFTVQVTDSFGYENSQEFSIGVLSIHSPLTLPFMLNTATNLVLQGVGFDPTPSNNTVTLTNNSNPLKGVRVTASTETTLTLSFPDSPTIPVGTLSATVKNLLGTSASVNVATIVSQAANGSLTPTTTTITPTPIQVIISGNGFATAYQSQNTVILSTGPEANHLIPLYGSVVSVVATSSNELEVTLDGSFPLPVGALWATVTVDGLPLGIAQIATVGASGQAPEITSSPAGLAVTAPSLPIGGIGFSTVSNGNSVQLFTTAGSLGSPILVTASSSTSLVLPLPVGLISVGSLYAKVTTVNGTSAKVQVAQIVVGTAPTVKPTAQTLAANAPQLVINGSGFSTIASDNSVKLSSGAAKVSTSTLTSLTLTFTQTPQVGSLFATVISNGLPGANTQVATVVPASTPFITQNQDVVTTSATTLVIQGGGFDTNPGGNNLVMLSSGTVSKVTVDSPIQMTVTLAFGPGTKPGPLTATVTVDGVASTTTQVATIGVVPVVTPSTTYLAANATTLTLEGQGFDPIAGNNNVNLSSGVAKVITATAEALVLQFTTAPQAGQLFATVFSDGISGKPAQVATVYAVALPSSANLAATAKTMTINGIGFNAKNLDSNSVALSSGSAFVIAASATSLTISFTSPPKPGPLKATAFVNYVINTAVLPTQVATIVAGPIAPTNSIIGVSVTEAPVNAAVSLTLQACDANGNAIQTGGAKVSFQSSAAGTFSIVKDNGNGTYSATFSTPRVGTMVFQATMNGAQVTQSAFSRFVFTSGFSGSQLNASWLVKSGGFTPKAGTAFALSPFTNTAIYNGPMGGNVTVSALVSNVGTGQFAGLVARYISPTTYYRAGILNQGGQTFAVIQVVGTTVQTVSKQAILLSGSARIRFTVQNTTLKLFIDDVMVGQATSTACMSGSAGISSGQKAGFSSFSVG